LKRKEGSKMNGIIIFLSVATIAASFYFGFAGFAIMIKAKSIMHQIAALVYYCVSAILFTGGLKSISSQVGGKK
jgi:hypothetical protein